MTKVEFRRAVERYRRFTKIVRLARKVERMMRERLMLASGWTTELDLSVRRLERENEYLRGEREASRLSS